MTVKVIPCDHTAFSTYITAPPSQEVQQYFQNNLAQMVNNPWASANTAFINNMTSLYDMFQSNEVIQRAREIHNLLLDDNSIHAYSYDTWNMLNNQTMLSILACPEVHELMTRNMCNGFNGLTGINTIKGVSANEQPLYMTYTNGVMDYDENGKSFFRTWSFYDGNDDINNVSFHEKANTYDNWCTAREMIKRGIDPTSLELTKL